MSFSESEKANHQVANFDVTIAGELNLDLILYGLPEQLPPERELLASDMSITLSCIGDDHLGKTALDRLQQVGVDVSKVLRKPEPAKTGLTVILQRDGWRNILTYPGTIFDLRMEDLDLEYLASSQHFHLSSFYLQKNLRPHLPELLQRMKGSGLTVSLDCNDDPADLWEDDLKEALRHVDVFLPNTREAMRIAGQTNLDQAIEQLSHLVPLLVVKLGAEGALARRGTEQRESPALKIDVIDAVGAGDSFDAGFLHQFIRGADVQTCLDAGNLAGALSTTRSGGTEAFRDHDHRQRFYRDHTESR